MLNYAYAGVEGQPRTELVKAGPDITVGFLHSMQPDRPTLVLDLLEWRGRLRIG
jgi:CRISPR/Cas system-associated endonuclease Cas1